MARKSPKCPPAVEPNQFGCVWNFGGMFDHHRHHGGPYKKLQSDEFRRSKSLPGTGQDRSQLRMLTFDEQLRSINIQSKKKASSANQSLKKTMEKSFWKKIKYRYENMNKKKETTKTLDRIVVLRPIERVVECPVDITCQCLHLHSHQRSTSNQHMVKHTHISFNDVRKKVENAKNLKSFKKKKTCGEINKNGSKVVNLSLVPYSKPQEPEVFMEARKHLAERLRLAAMGAGLGARMGEPLGSYKKVSRTLEKILLLSPQHQPMASFGHEPEVIHDDSMFSSMGSDQNNTGSSPLGTNGCIEAPQKELLLDVSSLKRGCGENPSPVSVLDSYFSDNISSPTSTIESVEHQIQPRRLDFDDPSSQTSSSSPQGETNISIFIEDQEFISSYVNEMYQTAKSNWVDFLATDLLCDHHQVLHDYVKEVLVSLHSRITSHGSWVRPFSLEKDVIHKVIDQVDWHNGQPMGPRTLDHLVTRDMAKCEPWLDTLLDRNDIVVEVADETLQELVVEAVYEICFLTVR